MRHALVAFLTGALFAVGLSISGMTRPDKVRGFLDLAGDWDPSLSLVMGGAVFVFFFAFRVITRRPAPLLGGKFGIPSRRDLDPALIGGAVLFGVGWGLGGFCPGPALTSVAAGSGPVLTFVASMLVGMAAHSLYARARARA